MVTRVLCSVSSKKRAQSQEPDIVALDAEDIVAEQVARLIAHHVKKLRCFFVILEVRRAFAA